MDIFEKYFGIFEGENDVLQRRQAEDIIRRAIAGLKSPKGKAAMETLGDVVIFDLAKLTGDPKLDLELHFTSESPSKHSGAFRPTQKPSIDLNTGIEVPPDPAMCAKILERMRSTFTHEIVHYLDFRKMGNRGQDVVSKAGADQRSKGDDDKDRERRYVSNPLEYNAFFQQGIANIENYLHSLPPESRLKVAKKMLGDSPDQFWKRITDSLKGQPWFHNTFVKNLDPSMTNKFKKRVASAYTTVMGSLESGQKWRGGPEKDRAAQISRLKSANAKAQKKGKE